MQRAELIARAGGLPLTYVDLVHIVHRFHAMGTPLDKVCGLLGLSVEEVLVLDKEGPVYSWQPRNRKPWFTMIQARLP